MKIASDLACNFHHLGHLQIMGQGSFFSLGKCLTLFSQGLVYWASHLLNFIWSSCNSWQEKTHCHHWFSETEHLNFQLQKFNIILYMAFNLNLLKLFSSLASLAHVYLSGFAVNVSVAPVLPARSCTICTKHDIPLSNSGNCHPTESSECQVQQKN